MYSESNQSKRSYSSLEYKIRIKSGVQDLDIVWSTRSGSRLEPRSGSSLEYKIRIYSGLVYKIWIKSGVKDLNIV